MLRKALEQHITDTGSHPHWIRNKPVTGELGPGHPVLC